MLFSAGSRKGLFDIAGNGKSGWVAWALPGDGDAVLRRLRKGLLEERLRERPGDERRSVDKSGISANFVFVTDSVDETGDKGALPGIDGSAIIMGGRNS